MTKAHDVVKIEKGVKLPEHKWASKNPLIVAMKKMKVGDSFLYPLFKRTNVGWCARKAGIVITTRTIDEKNMRCWRIK